ncbi:hypothetical protein [uncultured Clostridium sp.]|uniref:hypothetical protein n=1 Tax=uncultured Clostridium sp. TaxID=59620 RepID=UPI0025EF9475|nr:hypothetical protein [uncultured Clostridium sp.]
MNMGMFEKVEFKLPQRWKLNYNKLLKVNPDAITSEDDERWCKFSEDILNMVNSEHNILLDVGWYPEFSIDGHFGLIVIENNEWQRPLETFVTRNVQKLTEKILLIVNKY